MKIKVADLKHFLKWGGGGGYKLRQHIAFDVYYNIAHTTYTYM